MYTWIKFRRLIFLNEFHNFVPGHNSITIFDITFQINRNKKANEVREIFELFIFFIVKMQSRYV